MLETLDVTVPHLPEDAPRYLMGVGTPDDILSAVERGIDMFDCVIPNAGRPHRARLYCSGIHNLRNARFADDPRPLDPLRLPSLHEAQPSLSPSSVSRRGNARSDAAHLAQSDLLSDPDARHPVVDQSWSTLHPMLQPARRLGDTGDLCDDRHTILRTPYAARSSRRLIQPSPTTRCWSGWPIPAPASTTSCG